MLPSERRTAMPCPAGPRSTSDGSITRDSSPATLSRSGGPNRLERYTRPPIRHNGRNTLPHNVFHSLWTTHRHPQPVTTSVVKHRVIGRPPNQTRATTQRFRRLLSVKADVRGDGRRLSHHETTPVQSCTMGRHEKDDNPEPEPQPEKDNGGREPWKDWGTDGEVRGGREPYDDEQRPGP